MVEELGRFYVETLTEFLKDEMDIYNEVSPEEWELIKPDPKEKANAMMSQIRNALREKGKCGRCSQWKMSALEIQDADDINDLEVGHWEPTQGLDLKDDLFPHVTGGLRNRRILVTSIDVRFKRK